MIPQDILKEINKEAYTAFPHDDRPLVGMVRIAEQQAHIKGQSSMYLKQQKEIERIKGLLIEWWKIANRIKESEAKELLEPEEFTDYINDIERKIQQFKLDNNI